MRYQFFFSVAIKEISGLIKRQLQIFLKFIFQLYLGIIDE